MTTEDLLLISAARNHIKSGTGKAIRIEAGLTLAQIGSVVGASASTVWRWEEGHRQPRGDHAAKWAKLLAEIVAANPSSVAA